MRHVLALPHQTTREGKNMAYVVRTTDGHMVHKTEEGLTEQAAKADAATRNKRAEDLQIKTRYEAVKDKS
jgi:hypothetical protein